MMTRPLSPLRNATFRVPLPAGDSFFVSQWIRNDPLSLMNVSVCMLPRPAQLASFFQATTCAGVSAGGGADWQPGSMAPHKTMTAARVLTGINNKLNRAAVLSAGKWCVALAY